MLPGRFGVAKNISQIAMPATITPTTIRILANGERGGLLSAAGVCAIMLLFFSSMMFAAPHFPQIRQRKIGDVLRDALQLFCREFQFRL